MLRAATSRQTFNTADVAIVLHPSKQLTDSCMPRLVRLSQTVRREAAAVAGRKAALQAQLAEMMQQRAQWEALIEDEQVGGNGCLAIALVMS